MFLLNTTENFFARDIFNASFGYKGNYERTKGNEGILL